MFSNGFSSFESLLVKSANQRESAELLLLCWIYANKTVTLREDRRYLERLAGLARHREDLDILLSAVTQSRLDDVQLAAEVLVKAQAEPATAFLREAVVLATSDGALSLRNHHILRFLADLSCVSPDSLRALYREVTGRTLAAPEDLSHRSHWQSAEAGFDAAGAAEQPYAGATRQTTAAPRASWRARVRRLAESQWHERRRQQRLRRQQAQQAREREQRREAAAKAEREQRARAEARRRAEEQARRKGEEEARQRWHQQEQQRREQAHRPDPAAPSYRVRRALIELELGANASRQEIKLAYRRLAQRHHPDRFHGQSEWRVTLASQRFQRIKSAYDLLMQHA